MRIASIGTGMIGGSLARRFAACGHQVLLAHRSGVETLKPIVDEIGDQAEATTPEDAAARADVVIIAVPLRAVPELPAEQLAGKIVIDPTNYYPGRDGPIDDLESGTLSSSERNAQLLPGARLVKAFNTIHFEHLLNGGQPAGSPARKTVLIAGDDPQAKATVARLADDIGFDCLNVGALRDGRKLQPGGAVYNQLLTRADADTALKS